MDELTTSSGANSMKESVEYARSYYTIHELAEHWRCSTDRILDLAMQGKLSLSVMADNWLVHGGGYDDPDNAVEVVQWDSILAGLITLPIEAAQALTASGKYTLQYLPDTEKCFTKIVARKGELLPVVTLEKIIVKTDDVETFESLSDHDTGGAVVSVSTVQKAKESQYDPLCTNAIANLFVVKTSKTENLRKWKRWAKEAKKNGLEAMAKVGGNKGKAQAMFYPDKVGYWLVKKGEKTLDQVAEVLENIFIG